MRMTSQWRDWQPTKKFSNIQPASVPKVPEAPAEATESSFGTLVTFGTPVHDHSAWEDDFHTWGLANCQFRERSFHSIRHLHGLFCDWCLANERVPCRLETFQRLLFTEGFVYADGLVYGLVPK
jgi:hypothetical protein